MNYTIVAYSIYLVLSVAVTVWVAQTLFRNGLHFLLDCFPKNPELARSINHLLVVGFYLVNLGLVSLLLRMNDTVGDARGVFDALSGKLGAVLLILGFMHFFNLLVLTKVRRRGLY